MTVTYEITATVEPALRERYERYMRETHIPDLLKTGHFEGASISSGGPGLYRVRYEARDRGSLERYLGEDAPRLRGDFNAHFPSGVEATRTEWDVIEKW